MSLRFSGLPSGLSPLLAALGIYGVVAFAIANRTREIGTRIALGATSLRIVAMVLLDGVKLALPGMLVGALLGVVLSNLILASWYAFFDRGALDLLILALAVLGTLGVVVVASSVPRGESRADRTARIVSLPVAEGREASDRLVLAPSGSRLNS